MNLEQLYKEQFADSHAAALQAVYNKGFSDAIEGAMAAGLPPAGTPTPTQAAPAPVAPVDQTLVNPDAGQSA